MKTNEPEQKFKITRAVYKRKIPGYNKQRQKQIEMVGANLPKAIEWLREKQEVFVFNKDGKTVAITTEYHCAAEIARRHKLPLMDALEAEPLP